MAYINYPKVKKDWKKLKPTDKAMLKLHIKSHKKYGKYADTLPKKKFDTIWLSMTPKERSLILRYKGRKK